MAGNLPVRKGPIEGLLKNNENRGVADKASKLKKDSSIRPAPSNSSKLSISTGMLLSSNNNCSSNLRNRTVSSFSVRSQLTQPQQLQKQSDPGPSIRPEDWVVMPQVKPSEVYNIDTDLESHLMCPSLAPAQYQYMMAIEDKFMTDIGFLARTKIDSSSRITVASWMTTVHRQFAEQQESLFLAINYMDRFLAANPSGSSATSPAVSPLGAVQRVAATALYVACKFEEIYAPSIDQICGSTDPPRASPSEIRRIEFEMLRSLRFRVNPPLLNHFLRRCSKAAGATAMLHSLGKYLIEIALYDPDLATGTKSSLVAAAASYIAIKVFGERTRDWDVTMEHYSGGYSDAQVRLIASKLLGIHRTLQAREGSMLVKAKWDDIIRHPVFAEWTRTTDLC